MAMTTKAQDMKSVEKISKALGDRNRLNIQQHITKNGGCEEVQVL